MSRNLASSLAFNKKVLEKQKSVTEKVQYVKSQGQTRTHHCHWTGCDKQVPPAMWGCKAHWMRLPATIRREIWLTYKIGQEVNMTPSQAYLNAAAKAEKWINENG